MDKRSGLLAWWLFTLAVLALIGGLGHIPEALGGTDGSLRWSYATGGTVTSPAVGANGTVYAGSGDGYVYALNPNGTLKWRYNTGFVVNSSPAIAPDGTVYVGSDGSNISYIGYVYAFTPNGSLKWNYTYWNANMNDISFSSSPAIGEDGTIYVGCGADPSTYNCLFALHPNGTLKWRFLTPSPIEGSPAIGKDGTIYVGDMGTHLYALNPNGSQKWAYSTGGYVRSSPAIGADGTIYVGSGDYYVYAINPNGTRKWRYLTGAQVDSPPTIAADGTIYVSSDALYALNPNGSKKWKISTIAGVAPAVGRDGTIYVSSDMWLYAITPAGAVKWQYDAGSAGSHGPAIGVDGTIYFPCDGGNLYAIYGSSGGLALSPWPMFHHDLRHTGSLQKTINGVRMLLLGQ